MEKRTETASTVAPRSGPALSLPARMAGMFLDPARVMASLCSRPVWFPMLLLTTLVGLGAQYAAVERIGAQNILLQWLKMNPMTFRQMGDSELEAMATRAAEWGSSLLYVGPAAALWAAVLLGAGGLSLLALMLGLTIGYRKFLSLLAHTFWVYTVATSIVLISVISLTSDPQSVDVQGVVQSNLGYFLNRTEHPVLYALGSSVDLFSFWQMILLGLGISVFTDRRWNVARSILLPLALWALYVTAKTAVVYAFAA